jgi:uncharacterized protein YwgA
MNRRHIALKLVLDELGITLTPNLFDEHLTLQKIIYLAQELGLPLGYPYSWNMRGPYSRELTVDGQALLHARVPGGWALEEATKHRLRPVGELLQQLRGPNEARELDKLASVLFVQRTGQGETAEEIAQQLRTAGKNFTAGDVEDALRVLPRTEPQGAT